MKNWEEFQKQMMLMSEIFNHKASDVLMNAYWAVLEPFTDEQCSAMFKRIVTEKTFWPKPAEMVEILQEGKEDQPTRAWVSLVETIRRVGEHRSVTFEDRSINAVVQFMGGWPAVCLWPLNELKWKEKEFIQLYRTMAGRPGPDRLPGLVELQNAGSFTEYIEPPVIIPAVSSSPRRISGSPPGDSPARIKSLVAGIGSAKCGGGPRDG